MSNVIVISDSSDESENADTVQISFPEISKLEKTRRKKKYYKRRYNQVEEENKKLRATIDEMTKKFAEIEANPTSPEAIRLAEENERFKQMIIKTEEQKNMAQANYEVSKNQIAQFKIANDLVQKSNEELTAAALKCLDVKKRALEHKKIVSRCFVQVMKENADIRSVLEEHLKQENKYREKLHEEQLNIEEILKSTQTADKHKDDPDIDDFDKTYKFE